MISQQKPETTLKSQAVTVLSRWRCDNLACSSVAFILWREDWAPEEWTQILDTTTPFVLNVFQTAGCAQMIESTWGRSLRNSVLPEHLIAVLQASGFNKIFCTPKASNGRQDLLFRIIWTDGDLPRLTTLSKQTSGCIGLAKGRHGMGLRCRQEAWKVICPSKDIPPDLQGATWIKIQPLPFGTSKDMLLQWALTCKWSIQPIRQGGATAWLIASCEPIPERGLCCSTLLLPPKGSNPQSPVLVGSIHSFVC